MRARLSVLALLLAVLSIRTSAEPGRRALLIGINDYSASTLPPPKHGAPADREWSNLDGAVNDVALMREMLVALYGFSPADIFTLTDQQATRDAILQALEQHLVVPAREGDIVYFYFSGHGSQVRNSLSNEADRFDESLVPADSRRGARDVRDKELLPLFNRILDRNARLTIVLDACHSGSGARGPDDGMRHRALKRDWRDVADRWNGPRPEYRGALILSAAQDFDLAFETLDGNAIRGAFTWALVRAMRDAGTDEPAQDTFLRARARLHADRPAQNPVLAGDSSARSRPLLAPRTDRHANRTVVAVEKQTGPATYLLQGGWASGLTVGSELRLIGDADVRVEVRSLRGIAKAEARVVSGTGSLHPGALLELAHWAAPPAAPLRVWIPRAPHDVLAEAQAFRREAVRRAIRWIDDPAETTPTHLLRWNGGAWELATHGKRTCVGATPLRDIPAGASLFVQLPAPSHLELGTGDGIELTSGPESAAYVLVGRLTGKRGEYAWVRPFVTAADRNRSALPFRTAWVDANTGRGALREDLARLRRVHGWHELPSPAAGTSHYQLTIRRAGDGSPVENGTLTANDRYRLVLRARRPVPSQPLYPRYVYVFVIDSHGTSVLLFPPPETGSVENLLPITPTPGEPLREPPAEIVLNPTRPFVVEEPYGVDTYFLLCTDEPLPSLNSLEWNGVLGPSRGATNALEELLMLTRTGTRGAQPILTPPNWSVDKVTFRAVGPRRSAR